MKPSIIPEKFVQINAEWIQSLIEENRLLREEIRVAREAADITAKLVVEQFEETEKILHRFQVANAQRKAVLDSASQIAIIATDANGIIKVFNTGAENLLGYQATEVIGKQTPQIFHLESELTSRAKALSRKTGRNIKGLQIFCHYAKKGDLRHREWTFVRKDGTRFPASLAASPLREPDGSVSGFLGIATDISEKRRSEHALQESEKKYRLLLKNLPNIVGKGQLDGAVDFFDDKVQMLTGYTKEEFLTGEVKWTDLVIEADLGRYKRVFSHAMKTRTKSYMREYRIRTKPGKIIWIQEGSQIICNEKGRIEFVIGAFLNITKRKLAEEALMKAHNELEMRVAERTAELADANRELQAEINERKHAEDALRKSEEKYRGIFKHAAGGIYQTTPDGRILTANPAFVRIMGYESEADLLHTVTDVKKEFYVDPKARQNMQKLFKTYGTVKGFETRFHRKDRRVIHVSLNAREVRDENQNVLHYEGFLEDITQRKRIEEFKIAKEAAEASAKAKSNFLANMSHEIRTPMNAIVGLTELALRSEGVSPRQRDYLAKIKLSSHTLLGIINDILDFSKIEAGRLDLEFTEFHLYDVMDNLSDMFSGQAAEKGIEIVISIDDDVPRALMGDPLRLGQVLTNLTNNAIKFTDEGEILVKAERARDQIDAKGTHTQHADAKGTHTQHATTRKAAIRFTVKDTGIGIPPTYMPQLFSAFTQANGTTTRKYGGTGLGLTICKHLVKMMGGHIEVESEPGKGAHFSFTLAFDVQREDKYQKPVIPPDLHGTRVLVVDDNETSRKIFTEILNSFGFEAMSVSSGKEALEALRRVTAEEPYSLVLMDWMMPEMDGITTLKKIRAYPSSSQLPVIMMTAFGREEVMRQAETAGVNGFLIKPVKQSVLFDTIINLFGEESEEMTGQTPTEISDIKLEPSSIGSRLLLAEDNSINRQVAKEMLERSGFIVDTAVNGREAVRMATEAPYDALLMDVQMPEMDGYEATRRIRDWEKAQSSKLEAERDSQLTAYSLQLPIIAMTAHAMKGDREKCLEAGMDDYIAKPIDIRKMFSILSRWVTPEKDSAFESVSPTSSVGDQNSKFENQNLRRAKEEVQIPCSLPGIEIETVLNRLGGNIRLLRNLLLDFRGNYADTPEKIKGALAKDDAGAICQMMHTIKGVAGNISAKNLQAAALEIEMAARRGRLEDIDYLLHHFEDALNQVLQSGKQLGSYGEKSGTDPREDCKADLKKATPMLLRLGKLLRQSDLEAVDYMDVIKPYLTGPPFHKEVKELADQISALDFDNALKILDSILGKVRSEA